MQLPMTLTVSRELGEQGMRRTLEAESEAWLAGAIEALRRFAKLPEWRTFKAEDFRAWYLAEGLPEPHSHKCWGAFTNRAAADAVIEWTGQYAQSVSPKTHGHPVKVWRGRHG